MHIKILIDEVNRLERMEALEMPRNPMCEPEHHIGNKEAAGNTEAP